MQPYLIAANLKRARFIVAKLMRFHFIIAELIRLYFKTAKLTPSYLITNKIMSPHYLTAKLTRSHKNLTLPAVDLVRPLISTSFLHFMCRSIHANQFLLYVLIVHPQNRDCEIAYRNVCIVA